jgi:hypothetical protein
MWDGRRAEEPTTLSLIVVSNKELTREFGERNWGNSMSPPIVRTEGWLAAFGFASSLEKVTKRWLYLCHTGVPSFF